MSRLYVRNGTFWIDVISFAPAPVEVRRQGCRGVGFRASELQGLLGVRLSNTGRLWLCPSQESAEA